MVKRKPFHQYLVLSDMLGLTNSVDIDEERVDITQVWHNMPIGQNVNGATLYGDQSSVIRLNATAMDTLAKAWLRYRLNEEEHDEEGG